MSLTAIEPDQWPSVWDLARQEADRHKWCVSVQRGCDAGPAAVDEWYEDYLHLFWRYCWYEHVRGVRRWREFHGCPAEQLAPLIQNGDTVVTQVVDLVKQGEQNLNILAWATRVQLCTGRVREVLEIINMNHWRECCFRQFSAA